MEMGSSKQGTESHKMADEVRINLGAQMNQKSDVHFYQGMVKAPNASDALNSLK